MLSQIEIINYLKTNKQLLQETFHLSKLGLFGSFARAEQTKDSDIDLIIEFEAHTENLYSLKQALKKLIKEEFNLEVDICREKYLKPYYKQQILRDAIFV